MFVDNEGEDEGGVSPSAIKKRIHDMTIPLREKLSKGMVSDFNDYWRTVGIIQGMEKSIEQFSNKRRK